MSDILVNATDDNFDSEVLEAELPVFVDFWVSWCPHCQKMGPLVEELAKEFKGKLKVVKVEIEDCPQTAQEYSITGLPTFALFENGDVVTMQSGEMPLPELRKFVEQAL